MKRALVIVLVACGLVVALPTSSWATWSVPGTSAGASRPLVGAATLNSPAAPAVVANGAKAVISWSAASLDAGPAATGYVVLRHSGGTTTQVCSTTGALNCTDAPPGGTAVTYGVRATFRSWTSAESPGTSFTPDATAPATSATVSLTPNAAGWIRAASTTVSLNATDAGSGVASLTYQIGTAPAVTVPAANPSFTVTNQGTTTVAYYAKDNSGNVEAAKTLLVKLDNVAPAATISFPNDGVTYNAATWQNRCRNPSNVLVSGMCGTATDATSGVATVTHVFTSTLGATSSAGAAPPGAPAAPRSRRLPA